MLIPFLRKNAQENIKLSNLLFKSLTDLVKGLKELTLNRARRKSYLSNVISNNIKDLNKSQLTRKVVISVSDRFTDMLIYISLAVFMFIAVHKLDIDHSVFVTYLPVILFLIPFTSKIARYFKKMNSVVVSLEEIEKIGVAIGNKKLMKSSKRVDLDIDGNDKSLITFKDVIFSYGESMHERELVFGPLNLKLKKGKITFIIGGNGSGKTTFAKILTGLYLPKKGEIYLNDVNINESNIDSYRNFFSAYYADSHVFEYLDHMNDNFLEDNGDRMIQLLEMESKVEIIDKQFSTTKLSYGQRCRLALIANVLENKEIYLFDEWAANQDPYFKSVFYHKILPYLKEKGKNGYSGFT